MPAESAETVIRVKSRSAKELQMLGDAMEKLQ